MSSTFADLPLLPIVVDTAGGARPYGGGNVGSSAESFNAWLDRARQAEAPRSDETKPAVASEANETDRTDEDKRDEQPNDETESPTSVAAQVTPIVTAEDDAQTPTDEAVISEAGAAIAASANASTPKLSSLHRAEVASGQAKPTTDAADGDTNVETPENTTDVEAGNVGKPVELSENPLPGADGAAKREPRVDSTDQPVTAEFTNKAPAIAAAQPPVAAPSAPVAAVALPSEPVEVAPTDATAEESSTNFAGVIDTAAPQGDATAKIANQVLVVDGNSTGNEQPPANLLSHANVAAVASSNGPTAIEQTATAATARFSKDHKSTPREKQPLPTAATTAVQPSDIAMAENYEGSLAINVAAELADNSIATTDVSTELPAAAVEAVPISDAVPPKATAHAHLTTSVESSTAQRRDNTGDATTSLAKQAQIAQQAAANERMLSDIERVRFVQRVARAMQTSVDRGGDLTLRLSPPELGSLRLQVHLRDGAMHVRLEAETASARSALLDNLPVLRDRLAEQNIRIDKFDVDLRQPGDGAGSGEFAGRSPEDAVPGKPPRGNRTAKSSTANTVVDAPRTLRPHPDGQLNIIV
jgi:flagellar hook-length control protein FliK